MEPLDENVVREALWLWAEEICTCGNIASDGDLWRGSAPRGWVACRVCHDLHYFELGFSLSVIIG